MPNVRRWLVAISILAASCGGITETDVSDTGTMIFVDETTPCWLIETGSTRYLPINLEEEFKEEGLRVRFEARRAAGSTICNAPVVEIVSMERI